MSVVDCGGGIAALHGMACMGDGWCCLIHPHPSPLPSRERGFWRLVLDWLVVNPAPHLCIAGQVRNDVTMRCIVFTLWSQCQALGQALIPLSSRERGFGRLFCLVVCPAALWIPAYAGMTVMRCRNDGTMLRIVFTLTLVLSHQGRGGFGRLCCLVVTPPCGYCLEASMTGLG